VRDQPHHGHDDLGVGEARDTVVQPGDLGVEVLLGDQRERRVGAALELAGEQPQVGAPALVPGQAPAADRSSARASRSRKAAGPSAMRAP